MRLTPYVFCLLNLDSLLSTKRAYDPVGWPSEAPKNRVFDQPIWCFCFVPIRRIARLSITVKNLRLRFSCLYGLEVKVASYFEKNHLWACSRQCNKYKWYPHYKPAAFLTSVHDRVIGASYSILCGRVMNLSCVEHCAYSSLDPAPTFPFSCQRRLSLFRPSDGSWRAPIELCERSIKAPHAAKTRLESNFCHG